MADVYATRRAWMVRHDLAGGGVRDRRVLDAMGAVPRHRFVPAGAEDHAYEDRPLPIGDGQTVSQPRMVAVMLEALELEPTDRLLEVGSGCGYAAAVAARLCSSVVAVERVGRLAVEARQRLADLEVTGVEVIHADGRGGWPPGAPYDAILVSAAAPEVPAALVDQLGPAGRLVLPLTESDGGQVLVRLRRAGDRLARDDLGAVAFVPLVAGTRPVPG